MRRICVFCGANPGRDPAYAEAARQVGRAIAERGLGLVYGGGSVGIMGMVADAALGAGGEVVGVIPRALELRELAHRGLTTLEVVGSMHERKARMAELSDAFVALPGGMGTLEELAEVLTWGQLGLHARPCGLLDVRGYFRPLIAFFDTAVEHGFLHPEHRGMIHVDDDIGRLIERFDAYRPPAVPRWLDRSTS
ncbi:MAG TPA: TIGR00730 family Rossman fold protein [Anaeromyxobacteraceae bacterium]|nr:TIGR00730 family Rossman fold protein [Anaeromyxobacteraceae bacterium]